MCALIAAWNAAYGRRFLEGDLAAVLRVLPFLPTPTHTGRTLLVSVATFRLATIAFGLSRSLPGSILTYAAVGAADQDNMGMRLNTIQLSIPDELRAYQAHRGHL